MKVVVILVALVTLAVVLPRSSADEDNDLDGWGVFDSFMVKSDAAFVEPVELSGQIKVDDDLQYRRGYRMDTITFMGFVDVDVANDKTCCEECKKIQEDTEFFGIYTETRTDYNLTWCECVKSKPGVLPLTRAVGVTSGKCGLWEYNGDGELGEDRFIMRGVHDLGGIKNISDASYCCETCIAKYPDTQLFDFIQEQKECFCCKQKNDDVPATVEMVNAIGSCLHDYKGSGSDRNIGVATEDSVRPEVMITGSPAPQGEDNTITVEAGQPVELECQVLMGSPRPDIYWSRQERALPSGEESLKADAISFPLTNRKHSGIYICSADNGLGEIVTSRVKLNVQHAPEIESEQTFIHSKEGDEEELTCIVHSSPHSNVTWYKDGKVLEESKNIISQHGNRHTLVITKITGLTLGKYECLARNQFGEDKKMIEVSGKASPAEFKSSVSVSRTTVSGHIKVEDELQYRRYYNLDTVNYLGYADDVVNDKTCCEECKKIYKDTEFVNSYTETGPDYNFTECGCMKSKPGVLPLTQAVGTTSGKCGLWEYNGDGELGEDRVIMGGTRGLGSVNNVPDASYCCETCIDKYPDTLLFDFFEEEKECYCKRPNNDDVPITVEMVNAIGTCLHDYKESGSEGYMGDATEDSVQEEDYEMFDYDSEMFGNRVQEEDYASFGDYDDFEQLEKELTRLEDYQENIEDYNYVPNPNASSSMNYEPMTREFMVKRIMDTFEVYFDTNPKDGNLTKEEFAVGVHSGAHMKLTWEELLKLIDENCDGAITDLEFRGLGDLSFNMMSMDKDSNFYITQEELGDDKLWKTLLDEDPDKDGMINIDEYSKFIQKRQIETDHCSAPPSQAADDKSLDQLFDDDEGDLGDGLDEIVVTLYRVRVGGEKIFYKKNADGGMELI